MSKRATVAPVVTLIVTLKGAVKQGTLILTLRGTLEALNNH